jgi:cell division protein FtsB
MLHKFRFFIIIFVLVGIFFPGFAKLQEFKTKLVDTENEIRRTQRQNSLLEEKIAKMQNQEYLEIVARDKMGVVKKGETVLKIIREGDEMPFLGNATITNTTKK